MVSIQGRKLSSESDDMFVYIIGIVRYDQDPQQSTYSLSEIHWSRNS